MIAQLSSFIIHLIQSTGYIGIFILMTLESTLIPIPSEIVMPFSGFLVGQHHFSFLWVVIAGTLGNLAGSLIAYGIGFWFEENILLSLLQKYGKFLLISTHDYEKSKHWFIKYGDKAVLISRVLPVVRTFISLPAGMYKMNIKKFSIYTLIGSLVWSTFLTAIGYSLGEKWNSFEGYFRKFDLLIVIGVILVAGVYIYHKRNSFKR